MHGDDARKIDLNLLAIFDAIFAERSLTRAGARLGMTQSAVSHALGRLRVITKDELFERVRRGVEPTPRAAMMAADVRVAMDLLRSSLHRRSGFDPATEERTFVVDLPAGFDAVVLPPLLKVTQVAPGLRFRALAGRATEFQTELRYGETWLALDYKEIMIEGFCSERLFEDEFLVLARKGHPILEAPITADVYRAQSHVAVSWTRDGGISPLDDRLEKIGVKRNTRVHVPLFSTIPCVIRDNDLIATAPARLARHVATWFGHETRSLAFALPSLPIFMVWHQSFARDAGHGWLRRTIKHICDNL